MSDKTTNPKKRRHVLATVKVVKTDTNTARVELTLPHGSERTKYNCLFIGLHAIARSMVAMANSNELSCFEKAEIRTISHFIKIDREAAQ